ncbi:MAG: VOC family protein, partial [Candidatus Planktophila sp.]
MTQSIFINMPVEDLPNSVEFFKALGFTVKEQFTGENNACMQVGDNIFAMLTKKEQFAKIIDKPVADKGTTEVLISVGLKSADDVRHVTDAALEQGARRISEP